MKKYRKYQTISFMLLILTLIICFSIIGIAFSFNMPLDLQLTITAVSATISLIVSFILKRKLDRNTFLYRHALLFSNLEPAFPINHDITSNEWMSHLKNNDFIIYKTFKDCTLLYKIHPGLRNSASQTTLTTILMIRNESLTFENELYNKYISDLEKHLYISKQKYMHRIIYQIKSGETFSEQKAKETNLILFMKDRQSHIILINLYFFKHDGLAYFIRNNAFSPSTYYTYATNQLLELLK